MGEHVYGHESESYRRIELPLSVPPWERIVVYQKHIAINVGFHFLLYKLRLSEMNLACQFLSSIEPDGFEASSTDISGRILTPFSIPSAEHQIPNLDTSSMVSTERLDSSNKPLTQ